MSFTNYMAKNFPDLSFRSPLFYSWNASLRFELGVNESSVSIHENPLYLQGVYQRAIELFESLHTPNDELYMVVDITNFDTGHILYRKSNIFAKYVKEHSLLYRLQYVRITEEDDDEIYHVDRFSLKCHRSDIRYAALLKAICNQDMGILPNIHYPLYFVNETKGTIFYVYDDRGCDLLGVDVGTIRPAYEKFNEWILDYDRTEIDETFA